MNKLVLILMIILQALSGKAQHSIADIDSLMHKPRVGFSARQARALNMQIYKSSIALNYKPGIAYALLFIALNHFNGNRYKEALKTIYRAEETENLLATPI